jgi:hypothetical protein
MTLIRIHLTLAAALTAALILAGVASAKIAPPCKGSQLSGSFKAVRGSEGAGNIVYRLTLTNKSSTTCTLSGLPAGQLLGKTGKKVPTHIRAAFAPGLTAVLVTLTHGKSAHANARFSPDVPGVGEQMKAGGQCEPTSYELRVSLRGGGTTTVKIAPPTPVCERGQLSFSAYGA